jgi:hypothetical protein
MQIVKNLNRNGRAEVFSVGINLYNLYRFTRLTFAVEPISLIEVHMANFTGSTYVNERGWIHAEPEDFPAVGAAGVYNKTTTHETAGMVTRFEEGQSARKKCGSVASCHWPSFRVSASKRLDMEEVSGPNPL